MYYINNNVFCCVLKVVRLQSDIRNAVGKLIIDHILHGMCEVNQTRPYLHLNFVRVLSNYNIKIRLVLPLSYTENTLFVFHWTDLNSKTYKDSRTTHNDYTTWLSLIF